jgi:hypothetical protein
MNALPPDIDAIADELLGAGAEAVVLSGSWARGAATAESDVDLYALGTGPAYRLERRAGLLWSLSWRSVAEERAAFDDPRAAGIVVPAWRAARLLRDPHGVAAALQTEARAWTWARLPVESRGRWAAEELTGYAEEVHKLVNNAARGRWQVAAVQRAVLALRLAPLLAPLLEIMCDSEDALWEAVGAELGAEWCAAQAAALGSGGEALDTSCAAALTLFSLAAEVVDPWLDVRQRAVVAHALALALAARRRPGKRV